MRTPDHQIAKDGCDPQAQPKHADEQPDLRVEAMRVASLVLLSVAVLAVEWSRVSSRRVAMA